MLSTIHDGTNLTPSEKDIFSKFHHKFRYNVRLAERRDRLY
jgi:peptidoglycan pentaglycine glycine transferase (the first glycine)